MRNSLYVSVTVLVMHLSACHVKEKPLKENEDVITFDYGVSKQLVLENYSKYDSEFFTDQENCFFEHYLETEFNLSSPSYDVVLEGFLIKYFYCPYNDFSFTLIRGTNGDLHYIGYSDLIYYKNLLDSLYHDNDDGTFSLMTDSLKVIEKDLPVSIYFNKLFRTDPMFLGFGKSEEGIVEAINLAYSLVYVSARKNVSGYTSVYESFFESMVAVDETKAALIKLYDEVDNSQIKPQLIFDDLQSLTYKYLDKKLKLYELGNRGLIGYKYEILEGKVQMSEILIPRSTRTFDPGSDLSYNYLFPDC